MGQESFEQMEVTGQIRSESPEGVGRRGLAVPGRPDHLGSLCISPSEFFVERGEEHKATGSPGSGTMDKKLPSPVFWVVKAESILGFALSGNLARRGC